MKLTDYVARYLASLGIRHVFAVSGGASLHFIHSLDAVDGIDFVCTQHEQAGAMAADGYARVTGEWGAAVATSGPGATNLITGICCSYYDSVPTIFLTGQVATFRMSGETGVRQIGFQETPILELCGPITNYAVQIRDPQQIRFELEKATFLARRGRPGPVLIDIPDDVQRMEVDPDALVGFEPPEEELLPIDAEGVVEALRRAERPVVVAGWGIRLARCADAFRGWIERTQLPVALTWAVADLLPGEHPCRIGTFGTHGTRYANFAVQNADLILAIGSRLDTKATGSPPETFAREATKIMVDIDAAELEKFSSFGLEIDMRIRADAGRAVAAFEAATAATELPDWSAWRARIQQWKRAYPASTEADHAEEAVNPYAFVRALSRLCPTPCHVLIDTGCSIAWMMQAFEPRDGQRLLHDFNNTAMGWALPAAIGACFARPDVPVVCISGDGSLMMNLQELATVARHELPITLFLMNNQGHSMIQQTQDQWLESRYLASSVEGGLAFPEFGSVARGFGWQSLELARNQDCEAIIQQALELSGPVFCDVKIPAHHRVTPQVKFGRPNEDPEPLLPRDEFAANMIVAPLEVSRER